MDLTSSIKRAPRWAILTVGGVGVGAGAIHLWRNRTTSTGDTPAAGSGADPTTLGPAQPATGGSSPAGVIVPPVIISGPSPDQSGTGLGDLQNLFMGGVQDLLNAVPQTYHDIYAPIAEQNRSITDTVVPALAAIAQAGPAPQPAITQPAVVSTPTPAAPPPPAPAPPPPPKPEQPRVDFPQRDRRSDDGKNVWCETIERHTYKNGTVVYVGDWHWSHGGHCN